MNEEVGYNPVIPSHADTCTIFHESSFQSSKHSLKPEPSSSAHSAESGPQILDKINRVFKVGDNNRANKLFGEIKEKGLNPNHVIYNMMIIGFCKFKDLIAACGLLDEMVQKGTSPKGFLYNTIKNSINQNRSNKEG
ncbi:hypothetical protein L1987_22595 [Smallanthus sonchifolius]|uniref:Uncharacterized protein n=1 Tax=Smallanthus sonchifolius TaxID=185202 RepID=A0ACB9IGR6_9ASTR|nr:hypothetical protein L1987_22595 [Smallanthus sonchifolius]